MALCVCSHGLCRTARVVPHWRASALSLQALAACFTFFLKSDFYKSVCMSVVDGPVNWQLGSSRPTAPSAFSDFAKSSGPSDFAVEGPLGATCSSPTAVMDTAGGHDLLRPCRTPSRRPKYGTRDIQTLCRASQRHTCCRVERSLWTNVLWAVWFVFMGTMICWLERTPSLQPPCCSPAFLVKPGRTYGLGGVLRVVSVSRGPL